MTLEEKINAVAFGAFLIVAALSFIGIAGVTS